jgi:hypothetical protein
VAAKCRTTISDPRIRDSSLAELEASLLFLPWEDEAFFERWDFMLGLKWTKEDLDALAAGFSSTAGEKSIEELAGDESQASSDGSLRFPLSLLVRPELIDQLRERAIPAQGGMKGMPHVPASALSLSDVRKEDFLRKMGALPAQDDDLSGRDPSSMFDTPSGRPQVGFKEGPLRRIGGRK